MVTRLCFTLFFFAAAGCRSADPSLYPACSGEPVADIIVTSNGWHTTLIFDAADVPEPFRSKLGDVAAGQYVSFGWGDEGFFRAEKVTAWMMLRALFVSRSSVMLAFGLDEEPETVFEGTPVRVLRIRTSRAGMEKTLAAVRATFAEVDGRIIDAGPGIDGGRFFQARGRYAFYHTCNQWTADCLAAGGLPVSALYAVTAGNVAYQVLPLARAKD